MNLAHPSRSVHFCATLALLITVDAHADTLHDIGGGSHRHHNSGWIFPEKIDNFTRVGAPQDVDGNPDVIAYYSAVTATSTTMAIVDIYPPTSAAPHARIEDAQRALRDEAGPDASAIGEARIDVGAALGLVAEKTATGADVKTPRALYFVDTGPWIVKIRIQIDPANEAAIKGADEFVRHQRWDTLLISATECIGPACKTNGER